MESLRERNKLLRQKFFGENGNLHSEVDSRMSTKPKDEPVRPSCTINLDPHSEVYNMNHKRRGIALIFSHVNFKKLEKRVGGEKDSKELEQTLKYLGFDVRVYDDSNVKTILSTVQDAAAEDHTDADCLVVAAMSHGESGVLYAADNVYPVEMLWSPFLGHRCPSLAGKPKLFFIQSCRGTKLDNGVEIIHETDSTPGTTYSLPAYADIMVAYSTYDGFYSWRNPENGSWFIQALCQELNKNWKTHDLLRMMTAVVRRVSIEYQSFNPEKESFHQKKQVPSLISMLTRLLFFDNVPLEYQAKDKSGK
ncbi:caspase drICE [Bombus vancouverensis nearcticus]|uniref:caspase drICE n=1 Tax=Bombus vancouverensis nearcticus TaxID=2705178 RepID=UPI00143C95F1|nr:caspase-like [Bombus vancouverensis nearcticus]